MAFRPRNTVILLLVGLPLATLAAGAATLALIGRGGLDAVADPVRRTAQVQQVDLQADEAAARLGLSGSIGLGDGFTRLALSGDLVRGSDAPLALRLEHPLDARLDRELRLQPRDDGWQAPAFDADVGWRLSVTPADGTWRLVARWPRGARRVVLAPALAGAASTAHSAGDGSR